MIPGSYCDVERGEPTNSPRIEARCGQAATESPAATKTPDAIQAGAGAKALGTTGRRVGLVIGSLGYGGGEGQLFELARALKPRYELFVYCLSERTDPYAAKLRALGIPVRVLRARGSFDPLRVVTLARALQQDRIELVHAFLYLATAYAYLATLACPGVRLVSSARNCKTEANPLRRALIRRGLSHSDAVVCNSRQMARFAADYYRAPADRIRVVYNGVDAARFETPRASRPRREIAGPVVGTVGRIERQKNLDVFLQAAACVRRSAPSARFEIVGEGSERERLEAKAASMGLGEALRFWGTTSDIPGFLAGIDQFWLTSDWEGTPNVVLEAMAAGVPVITTRVGGTEEIVEHAVTGLLVATGDAQAVCAASLELTRDVDASHQMAERARAAVRERFSLDRMAAETAAVYEAVVERGQ